MASVEDYRTASGAKRYRARYRDPDRKQRDKWGFTTKRAAEEFLATVTVSKLRGEFIRPEDSRVTIGELAVPWMASQVHLKPSSLRPLEIAWRLHVAPTWEDVAVSEVRHSEVQRWVNKLDGTRGATTVLRAYGVLASILDVAVKDRRVLANTARGVNLPRKKRKEHPYLSHAQVETLAGNAGEHGTLVRFLSYTGLRWGEAVGLRVMDLDMLRRRVKVQQNAVMVNGTYIVGTPKSHEARSVPFPEFLSEALAKMCEGKPRTATVFGDGRAFLPFPDNRTGWWVRALEASVGVPNLTRHDLRHTAASLAVSSGANVKAVQRMLGHASAAMTLDVYADLFDDDLDGVATALNQARALAIVV